MIFSYTSEEARRMREINVSWSFNFRRKKYTGINPGLLLWMQKATSKFKLVNYSTLDYTVF